MKEHSSPLALYLLMFNLFITMAGMGLVIPIMPDYLEKFGAAGRTLGLLIAMFSFAQFIFSPIAAQLSDKHGRKKMIVIGLLIYSVAQFAFGLANHIFFLYLGRFLSGLGTAFIMPPTMAFVADVTTEKQRGRGMGLLSAAMSLGFMIGPALGGFLSIVSLTFPFFFGGVVALLAAALSYFALPNPKIQTTSPLTKPDHLFKQLVASTKKPYFILLIIMFVFSFGLANLQSTLSLYMAQIFHSTPKEIAIIITVGGFIGVVVQTFFVDKLAQKYGDIQMIITNLLIASLSLFGMLLVHTYGLIILVAAIFYTATSLLRPIVNALISKRAGTEQGFAAGMITAYFSLGNMIGPALAGSLFDLNSSLPFTVGSIALFLCFCITIIKAKEQQTLTVQPTTKI